MNTKLSYLGDKEDFARARIRAVDGLYPSYLSERFPNGKHKDLPIVGQDFTYYMDIMFLTNLIEEDRSRLSDRRTKSVNIRALDVAHKNYKGYAPKYICALVIVEATTRKAWVYPLHSKNAKEVLYAFKRFLTEVDMKISRLMSDMGTEYSGVIAYNKRKKLFQYFQVNASQNMHTTLSRVDRFIRTLREIMSKYYNLAESPNWALMVKRIVDRYNNTPHSSLFLRDPDNKNRKIFYTPQQVWKNPELRRRIKIKDYLAKYKNYEYIDRNFKVGTLVRYRVLPGQMKNRQSKGFLSQYAGIIREKVGNSFKVQLKTKEDIKEDIKTKGNSHFSGEEVILPARDIVPYENTKKRGNSKYNLEDLFNFNDQDNEEEEEEDKEVRMEINRGPGKRQRKPNSLFFSADYLNPVG